MAKTYWPGERYSPDPGTHSEMRCLFCDTIMDVERNCHGPRGFASAMGGPAYYSWYDSFTCPHAGEDWHEQARLLHGEIKKTPSAVIADMLKLELFDVIQRREPTRKPNG